MRAIKKVIIKYSLPLLFMLLFCETNGQRRFVGIAYEPSFATSFSESVLHSNPPIITKHSSRFANSFGFDYIKLSSSKSHGLKTGIYLLDIGSKSHTNQEGPNGINSTYKWYTRYISIPVEFYKMYEKLYFNVGPGLQYTFSGYTSKSMDGEKEWHDGEAGFSVGIKTEIGLRFKLMESLNFTLGAFNRLFIDYDDMGTNYGLTLGLQYEL